LAHYIKMFEKYYQPCECGRGCRYPSSEILEALKSLMVYGATILPKMVKHARFEGWADAVTAMYEKRVFFDEKLPTAIFVKWLLTCGVTAFDYAKLWNPIVAVAPDIEFVTCNALRRSVQRHTETDRSCGRAGCAGFCRHNAHVVFGLKPDRFLSDDLRMVMVPGGLRWGSSACVDKLLMQLLRTKSLDRKKANTFIDQKFLKKVKIACAEIDEAKNRGADVTPVLPPAPPDHGVVCNTQLVLYKRACDACGRPEGEEGLYQCGRCMHAFYCSAECQKASWNDHKTACKA